MRNWNSKYIDSKTHVEISTKTTYEELKQCSDTPPLQRFYTCTKTTYEELKPIISIYL